MYAYRVYGLVLHSELPIPELLPASESAPDIVVTREAVPRPDTVPESADDSWAERDPVSDDVLCVFSGVGRYVVRGGSRVVIDPEWRADESIVRHLLLGPVLAHLLWQRGIFTLHASVVRVRDRHVAFVGISGEGKSTTAAALASAGHALVCDDVAALRLSGDRVRVLPGFPRVRLNPDSIVGIGDDPARHPSVHAAIDKRSTSVADFVPEDVALDHLYVLASGDDFATEPLSPADALIEVLRNTYYAHQYAPLYGFPHHLAQAKLVVERVPVSRLTRPKDLARLPELCGFIEAQAAA